MKAKVVVTILLLCLLLGACSRASNPQYDNQPAGFWDGIWHGMTAGFILLWDTFFKVEDPTLYASQNIGYWYNCGYICMPALILGIIGVIFRAIAES
jgi:hypothetical protein